MELRLQVFPVRYPPVWVPSTSSLGPRGTRRISFLDNFGDGRRSHDDDGRQVRHGAIDIFGDPGLIVVSTSAGRVARHYFIRGHRYRGVDTSIQTGNRFVVILDDFGFMHYYAHLSGHANGLRPGERVSAGQILGWLGSSGNGPDPHLHYQVHQPKRDTSERGTGGFAADEIDRKKENPFPELSRVAGSWFQAANLVEVDRGLHPRYHNSSGNSIRPRIVIRNGPLGQGVAG